MHKNYNENHKIHYLTISFYLSVQPSALSEDRKCCKMAALESFVASSF
jgi:hypothetical protein